MRKMLSHLFVLPIVASMLFAPAITFAADTWLDITPSGTSSYTFTTVATMSDYVYVGTNNGIYKSDDAGQSWAAVNTGLSNLHVTSIAIGSVFDGSAYVVTSDSPIFVGTQNGIFKSTLGGTTWTAVNTGLTNLVINDIEIDQYQAAAEGTFTNVYAATEAGVFLSTDEGATWALINSGMIGLPVQKITSDFNGYVYAISSTSSVSKVFSNSLYSVSGSNDPWTEIYSESGTTTHDITMLNPIGLINWIATDKGILKSEDNGMDWKIRNTGLTSLNVSTVVSDYADANIAYAAVPGEGVYRTTVEPLDTLDWRWLPINQDLTDLDIEEVKTNPGNSQLVYAISADGVYKLELSDVYVDLTNPSAISDLDVTVNDTQIILDWTAPGEDGIYGTSTSYVVKYASSTITEGNWASATTLPGQPTPRGYGYGETFIITSLSTTTPYYFAVKAIDDDGNESVLSNVVASIEEPADTTAPVISSVSSGSLSTSGATITWTTNEAATSKVLYGKTSGNYASLTASETLTTSHSRALTSLSSNTTYYYVVVSTDAASNTATSTQATFTTSRASSGGGGGGGGGGGSSSGGSSSSSSSSSSTTNTTTTVTSATTGPTEAELLAIIQSLIAQIQAIAKQRGITIPIPTIGGAVTTSTGTISRDLELGAEGEDVRTLQRFLNSNGYVIAATGVGSPGNESTYFGPATRAALIKFQLAKGITPAAGYFGPKTKALTGL